MLKLSKCGTNFEKFFAKNGTICFAVCTFLVFYLVMSEKSSTFAAILVK